MSQLANTGTATALRDKPKRFRGKSFKEAMEFYVFISPWFVVFVLLGLIPLLYGLYLSLTNYAGFNMDRLKFVGFDNYRKVFTDNDAMYSLGRTLLITAIMVPLSTVLGFLLAVLLNQNIKNIGFYRTLFFIPSIIPVVAVGTMWRSLFVDDGVVNNLLADMGLQPVDWLGYDYAMIPLLIMLLWGVGGGILVYLAGLKGVSKDLYEAAAIDGATTIQRFARITIPLVTPVLFFQFIMSIIGSLQIFVQPILLAANSNSLLSTPIRPNYVYSVHAFQQIFAFGRFGYGLALLWVLFIMILVLTVVVFSTSKLWVFYEVDQEGK
ncbi:carbohydrate ABC transporter permease [Cohnella herbarum]|jgi:ABC-type sugar transport system permease subunit|uniref:Sugar ABC transporter permease n=1 Tax=Cohnella herbarum TaxID=2728023 RepID=A0A7Z2ZNC0_9BACL|nr:sugar ABC transporter permease [Cohnella herbarum]QJD84922.1 sugar ABC transporter permease [Cohnella herbarum]